MASKVGAEKKNRSGREASRAHRRRRRRWIAVGIVALLLVAGGAGAWQWNERRGAPEPAPRFNLMASTGKTVTLEDFLGKQEVVLIFYMGAT